MENPENEIKNVVTMLTAAVNPDVQKATVEKYYASNAEFHHPLCVVGAGHNSRDSILGILQWYRVMSPHIKIDVRAVTYDSAKNELFLDVVQEFHIRWSPFRPAPARLMVHLKLRPSDDDPNLSVIYFHEDLYHPEDLLSLTVPPLVPLVRLVLSAGALASNINAKIFGYLGFWSVRSKSS